MRILHLASGNRWTGAAAPAFAEVEALREGGIDAHYAYVGGYKLEAKLRGIAFAHPVIEKAQNPVAFLRSLRALEGLGQFDWVHAHLTWDHVLALRLASRTGARLARTLHAARVVRRDPLTRLLLRRTAALFSVNADLARSSGATFTPPPLDRRAFTNGGANVRVRYGIDPSAPVAAVIGKVAPGRGFETALDAFARLRRELPGAVLLVIGHGPHQPVLEKRTRDLSISDAVIWAGYHEDDLAEHYRAADVLLFTAAGSDEGHRAVIEAMACGVPPATAPLPGMRDLLEPLDGRLIARDASGAEIAAAAAQICHDRKAGLPALVARHALRFDYAAAAKRLSAVYAAGGADRMR